MQSDAELHPPRRPAAGDLSERRRAGKGEGGTIRLKVVQHVGNLHEELCAHALLPNADILHNVRVEIPGWKTTQVVIAAAACIESQHAGPEFVPNRSRV